MACWIEGFRVLSRRWTTGGIVGVTIDSGACFERWRNLMTALNWSSSNWDEIDLEKIWDNLFQFMGFSC